MKKLNMVKGILQKGNIVALTGAAISVQYDIPTFKGISSVLRRGDPVCHTNPLGFGYTRLTNPHKTIDYIIHFFDVMLNSEPNAGHFTLSKLEEQGLLISIITQNIEGLHQKAGNNRVVELYGNMFEFLCLQCNKIIKLSKEEILQLVVDLKKNRKNSDILDKHFLLECKCSGRIKPNIVLFGEPFDQNKLNLTRELIKQSDTFLVIGTSGIVYPAASLPWYAKKIGKTLIEVNPEITAFSAIADYFIMGKASDVLPSLL